MTAREIMTVHGWPDFETALSEAAQSEAAQSEAAQSEADTAVTLQSGPGAGIYGGPSWWRALLDRAEAEFPHCRMIAILDCADSAGAVMAAIRTGIPAIRFTGDPAVKAKLAAMADQAGCRLI